MEQLIIKKECMKTRVRQLVRVGLNPMRSWRSRPLGMIPTNKQNVRRSITLVMGKKRCVSGSVCFEVHESEWQHELAIAATCFGAQLCW